MKDKWINIGYEGDELKPYKEPEEDFGDTKRIGEGTVPPRHPGVGVCRTPGTGSAPSLSPLPTEVMVGMGYTREEIKESLSNQKYNEVMATYLLLGRKNEVR